MIQLEPLHDRVIIKRTEEAGKTRSGLYIPDTAKEKPQQGEVIAVGAGQVLESGKRIPPDLKVGDHVLFGKSAGMDVIIGDEEYVIMREREILGRIGIIEKAKRARK
jgi:chaperonin GroES